MANKSDYGLAGTVISEDYDLAEKVAIQLRVGSVAINDSMASYSNLPSGGIKMSGHGKECYKDGLIEIGCRKSIYGNF